MDMAPRALVYFLIASAFAIAAVNCNLEVDVLSAWKSHLTDPNNLLQSWDPTLLNPCSWLHITCDSKNSVTRVDLGDAGLQGPLVPQLGQLSNLQYLEVYNNKITGSIPGSIGNLTNLISLSLHFNQLSGPIPASLGNIKSLTFLRLNNNKLSGSIPTQVIQLILYGNLRIMNVANNSFEGTVHPTNSKGYVVTRIIQDPKAQK